MSFIGMIRFNYANIDACGRSLFAHFVAECLLLCHVLFAQNDMNNRIANVRVFCDMAKRKITKFLYCQIHQFLVQFHQVISRVPIARFRIVRSRVVLFSHRVESHMVFCRNWLESP